MAKRRNTIIGGGLAQHFWHSSVVPRAMISRKSSSFTESVIREMTRLNAIHGGINLAQGFPDFDGPEFVKDAAVAVTTPAGGRTVRGPVLGLGLGLGDVAAALSAAMSGCSDRPGGQQSRCPTGMPSPRSTRRP